MVMASVIADPAVVGRIPKRNRVRNHYTCWRFLDLGWYLGRHAEIG